MSLKITDDCISMSASRSARTAPSPRARDLRHRPQPLHRCVGHYDDEPQCQQVCPVDCIPLDENNVESRTN